MIENFNEKLEAGLISLEFGETGIVVIERRYRETDGVPIMKPTHEVSSQQLTDLIADKQNFIAPLLAEIQDLTDMKASVITKEEERDNIIANNNKKK